MENKTRILPNEQHAVHIVQKFRNESVLTVERFTTGLRHFVYDVVTESHRNLVVRIARPENKESLQGTLYWYQYLKPRGVPLAEILSSDLESETSPFPYLILERLAGKDLGLVYLLLSQAEKKVLAGEIASIQEIAGSLPLAKGFGLVGSYESGNFQKRWIDVIYSSLERSRKRIRTIGAIDSREVDRVEQKIVKFERYFSQLQPKCFLDDTTTKNVIVDDGRLSGVVDVDVVCFGDNLFPIALTRMSLLNTGFDPDYIDFWCDAAALNDEQKEVLQFYTALFCVDFMGEIGQVFNREKAPLIKSEDTERLMGILDILLGEI